MIPSSPTKSLALVLLRFQALACSQSCDCLDEYGISKDSAIRNCAEVAMDRDERPDVTGHTVRFCILTLIYHGRSEFILEAIRHISCVAGGKGAFACIDPIGGKMAQSLVAGLQPGGRYLVYGSVDPSPLKVWTAFLLMYEVPCTDKGGCHYLA